MKRSLFFILLLIPLFWSCVEDAEPGEEGINDTYLRAQIDRHKVEALVFCCSDCDCIRDIGYGTDFGFPGNNQVRIRREYYDLENIVSYRIETVHDNWDKEIQMILFFG